MALPIHSASAFNLDLEQILLDAQHRWLRPFEVSEILRNYTMLGVAPEPPHTPPSGSLFLFNRKVLRYFRNDGHSWRKKKDGKTISEAHEKLKVGSVDLLHCYYAHGEDNGNFQRRSYWLLEKELSHIVLVHYREVKGYRTNFKRVKEAEEAIVNSPEIVCNSEADHSMHSNLQQNSSQMLFRNVDSRSLNSAYASDCEDAESGSCQAKPTLVASLDISKNRSVQKHQKELDFWGWEDALESHDARTQSASVSPSSLNREPDSVGIIAKQGSELGKLLSTYSLHESLAFKNHVQRPEEQQITAEDGILLGSTCKLKDITNRKLHNCLGADGTCMGGQTIHAIDHGLQVQLPLAVCEQDQLDVENNLTIKKRSNLSFAPRSLFDRSSKDEGLKKNDSFSRWMSRELEDVEQVTLSSSGSYWDPVDNGSVCPVLSPEANLDLFTFGPSYSQEQLFRIIDFSPNWAYAGSETKVLIAGEFLKTQENAGKCHWSCMFGEVEVPAEVIADGVLRCDTPLHGVARVPFYITCSNRVACSEVREFEFRDRFFHGLGLNSSKDRCEPLQVRFGKLLSLGLGSCQRTLPRSWGDSSYIQCELSSVLKVNDDDWFQILKLTEEEEYSVVEVKERLVEKLLKENFCEWLLCKETELGNDRLLLDEDGLGVLHFAAALGYDWAISPLVAVGVNINFRDVHGRTALHWAASYGRERAVGLLISLGASAGALTDPTPAYPMGRTAADLASENGHRGIAGYLAESALSAHLECLTLKDKTGQFDTMKSFGTTPVLTTCERIATPISNGEHLSELSLQDSIAAVRNAAQAAARIHQVYRVQSFQRKQMRDFGHDKLESSDDDILSVITVKTHSQCHHDEPVHAAAVRIQNKFRSWKGRRQFLTIRQQIVKIQAHVRGHQVRIHHKKFVWSVGILEKVILRWRRKRSGLRGFKSELLNVEPCSVGTSSKEDHDNFLKEGRKQAEERLQRALHRVKSMVRYPEARDQYRRLLTTVTEIREMKEKRSVVCDDSEAATSMDSDLVDLDTLLSDAIVSTDF